ncbi:hypothetical protein [Paenibacillus jiagnxiensis]|uniref:hypothetical protein n=1 Tax=Paenibacillus jiagnxiensis TaxID=3228926 RepID=UPI0033BD79BF
MAGYRDIEGFIRLRSGLKILVLDTNNIQFYYQNAHLLPPEYIFKPYYDMVIIPGWVHSEYAHHEGKSAYIFSLPLPIFIVAESEDYLPMLGYSDKRLMELFRVSSLLGESQQFFNRLRRLEMEDFPDDWIDQFYEQGFPTKQSGNLVTKKNAGEVSILALTFCLLSHYRSQISNISIASSDYGIVRLKQKVLKEANALPLELGISNAPPISYLTTDVSLFNAFKTGLIQPHQVSSLRPNPKSSQYIELFNDGTSALHEHVLDTTTFLAICQNHDKYKILF